LFSTKKIQKKDFFQRDDFREEEVFRNLGLQGEDLASNFLVQKGYRIVERNYRIKGGEVDLIALENENTLHFIEVKTRSNRRFGDPLESIDAYKRKRLSKAALVYLMKHPEYEKKSKFFSVIVIDLSDEASRIDFYPNAFGVEGGYY